MIAQFERPETLAGPDASVQRFEQARSSFLNIQRSSQEFQSLRQGVLPPGVTRKSFSSPDNAEMYAVAVYIPSVSHQAMQAAKEMAESQLIQPLGGGQSATPGASIGPSQATRPGREVAPGPTGQVSPDQEL